MIIPSFVWMLLLSESQLNVEFLAFLENVFYLIIRYRLIYVILTGYFKHGNLFLLFSCDLDNKCFHFNMTRLSVFCFSSISFPLLETQYWHRNSDHTRLLLFLVMISHGQKRHIVIIVPLTTTATLYMTLYWDRQIWRFLAYVRDFERSFLKLVLKHLD